MATYPYRCPKCGESIELRSRVTMRERRCPHCGYPIKTREIDRQMAAMAAAAKADMEAMEAAYMDAVRRRRRQALIGSLGGLALLLSCCGGCSYLVFGPSSRKEAKNQDQNEPPPGVVVKQPDKKADNPAPRTTVDDKKIEPRAVDSKDDPPKDDIRFGLPRAARMSLFAAWQNAPHVAENQSVEEFGHRPRGKDSPAYGIKFSRAVELKTKNIREQLLKDYKLNRTELDEIIREGSAAGWEVPVIPKAKERD